MYPFPNNSGFDPTAMQQSMQNMLKQQSMQNMMNISMANNNSRSRMPSYGTNNMMGMIMANKMGLRGAQQQQQASLVIRPNDVLCGRGKTSFNHSGNRRFRHIISQSIDEYRAASSKWEKSLVAARLVSVIHSSGGRFLKQKQGDEDQWYELSSSEAKSKVSHAVRDAIAITKQSRRTSNGSEKKTLMDDNSGRIPSCSGRIPSCTASSCTPMDDSSSATAATAPMDDMSSSDNMDASGPGSFVRPRYRGTWSSNSLVSLSEESEDAFTGGSSLSLSKSKSFTVKPDSALSTKKMSNECWSAISNSSDDDHSGDSDFDDDFQSYIHQVLGKSHR